MSWFAPLLINNVENTSLCFYQDNFDYFMMTLTRHISKTPSNNTYKINHLCKNNPPTNINLINPKYYTDKDMDPTNNMDPTLFVRLERIYSSISCSTTISIYLNSYYWYDAETDWGYSIIDIKKNTNQYFIYDSYYNFTNQIIEPFLTISFSDDEKTFRISTRMGETNKSSWTDNFTCIDSNKYSQFKNYLERCYNDFVGRNY
jgi:hypothetical protein